MRSSCSSEDGWNLPPNYKRIAALLTLLATAAPTQAQLYSCVEDGKKVIRQQPCPATEPRKPETSPPGPSSPLDTNPATISTPIFSQVVLFKLPAGWKPAHRNATPSWPGCPLASKRHAGRTSLCNLSGTQRSTPSMRIRQSSAARTWVGRARSRRLRNSCVHYSQSRFANVRSRKRNVGVENPGEVNLAALPPNACEDLVQGVRRIVPKR